MQFKLYLLTQQIKNNAPNYTLDLITSFISQAEEFMSIQNPIDKDAVTLKSKRPLDESAKQHSYTYDEKFKISLNSKKTLSFSMNKKVMMGQDYIENPFVNVLQVGSQLLLEDTYKNHHVFLITDIKYTFSSTNIVYTYSCEDAFSYTTSRQNSGYTLENDSESEDFIGARTLDWWVLKHIAPDCGIRYTYLQMEEGLYEDNNGNFKTFYKEVTKEDQFKKYIKEAYVDVILDDNINAKVKNNEYLTETENYIYKQYLKEHALHESIAFSCSSSSANAALISLAEQLDLQVVVFEHYNEKTYQLLTYYWFEPKKNDVKVTGLQYSPKDSINSFSLNHSGKSLTTILNVTGPTYDDELITLIPDVSPFFFRIFNSSLWESSKYEIKSYEAFLQPQVYTLVENSSLQSYHSFEATVQKDFSVVFNMDKTKESWDYSRLVISLDGLPIWDGADNISSLYNKLHFTNSSLVIRYKDQDGIENTSVITPATHKWHLVVKTETTEVPANSSLTVNSNSSRLHITTDDEGNYYEDFSDGDTLSSWEQSSEVEKIKYTHTEGDDYYSEDTIIENTYKITTTRSVYLLIDCPNTFKEWSIDYDSSILNIVFDYDYTIEDYNFAKAADKCPWLENKLIDFSYFRDYNILSESEYRELLKYFYEDLRIINGKLMCFAASYYNALRDKAEILANITNNFESLGAACQASILTPYQNKGIVTDYSYFNSAYNQIFTQVAQNRASLFNQKELITEYFNKYMNAQQRFLKNIYNFRKFFNAKVSVPGEGIFTYKMSIKNDGVTQTPGKWTRFYYTFENTSYDASLIDSNFEHYITDTESTKYGASLTTVYNKKTGDGIKQFTPVTIVSRDNFEDYYVQEEISRQVSKSDGTYNNTTSYYYRTIKIPLPTVMEINGESVSVPEIKVTSGYSKDVSSSAYDGIWLLTKTVIPSSDFEKQSHTLQMYVYKKDYAIKTDSYGNKYKQWYIYLAFAVNNEENYILDFNNSDFKIQPVKIKANGTYISPSGFVEGFYLPIQVKGLENESVYDYMLATNKDLINNYIANTSDIKIYKPNYDLYLSCDKIKSNGEKMIKCLDDSYDEDDTIPYNEETYWKNLPFSTLYWYGIKTAFIQGNANEKDQFIIYDNNNVVIEPSKIDESNKQYLPIHYVTNKNVNKYFKQLSTNAYNSIESELSTNTQSQFEKTMSALCWRTSSPQWSDDVTKVTYRDFWGVYLANDDVSTGFIDLTRLVYSPVKEGSYRIRAFAKTCGIEQMFNYYAYCTIYQNLALTSQVLFDSEDNSKYYKYPENKGSEIDLSNLLAPSNFYAKDTTWRKVKIDESSTESDSCITKSGKYYLLNLSRLFNQGSNLIKSKVVELLADTNLFIYKNNVSLENTSGTIFYPLIDYMQSISFSSLNWYENNKKAYDALNEYVEKVDGVFNKQSLDGFEQLNNYTFIIYQHGVANLFMLFEKRDYYLQKIEKTQLFYKPSYYQNGIPFYSETGLDYPFDSQSDFTKGYYTIKEATMHFIRPTEFDMDASYYNEVSGEYIPIYTIRQIINLGKYYYFDYTTKTETSFTKNKTKFDITIYQHEQVGTTNEDGSYIIESDRAQLLTNITSFVVDWKGEKSTTVSISNEDNFLIIKVEDQTQDNDATLFTSMTNGSFWYRYARSNKYPICFSQAAAIEAQLTEYWDNAYTASKFCEYYLPDTWVQYSDQKENYTFEKIFKVTSTELQIIDDILPQVEIFTRRGNAVLDKFQWTYNPPSKLSSATQVLNQNIENEYVPASQIEDNEAIRNIMIVLGEDIENFQLERIGKQTYYYSRTGGIYWNELIKELTGKAYEQYNGLYVMIYQKLLMYDSLSLDTYEKLVKDHDNKWKEIYQRFNYVVLENSYTNNDATTTNELYTAAYYYFLDLTKPERQYNISITDLYLLKGYHGQELKIGDPIELRADDFYSKQDLIYKSLKQYLFISDLSYDLRNQSKLTVTINNVKYSDKLINRLVSLIK